MTKKRWFTLTILILVLATTAWAYQTYQTTTAAAATTAQTTAPLTATVRRGNLIVSAAGAGTIIPATQMNLGFTSSGQLLELAVGVGDTVAAGDILARIDDTNAQQALANAELQYQQASLQLADDTRQRTLALAQIQVDQAQLNLTAVQTSLDDLLDWEADETAVTAAQAALAIAQANADSAATRDSVAYAALTSPRVQIETAQTNLNNAQVAYDTAWQEARDWELQDPRKASQLERERESTAAGLVRAQNDLAVAQSNYSLAAANVNNDNALGAQTSLLNAQNALTIAQTGPSDSQIAVAQQQLTQAQLNHQQAQLNYQNTADTSQAEISLAQAQLNLTAAQRTLDATVLTAPQAGTITAITANVGESVGTAPLITLADLEQPLLEIFLDESDLDKVGLGYEVEVIFDALPDDLFTGHIIQIDPTLTTAQNVVTVRALVQLDPESYAKPQTLPIGLNASIEVIGGRAENSLLVPVEALREITPGQYTVFVVTDDGELELTFVEVGLIDFAFAEILDGLTAGQTISTGLVDTE